jgi:hypothetical protein
VDLQAVKEQPQLVHPDIIAEVPGMETEDIHDKVIWPTPIGDKKKPPSYDERAIKARKNQGLEILISRPKKLRDKMKALSLTMVEITLF